MMQSMKKAALVLFMLGSVSAHSWIENPVGRFSTDPNYCLTNDDGTLWRDAKGATICGKDAQGIDLYVMRPKAVRENPCFFGSEGTFGNAPASVVEEDGTLCVQWSANAHDTDADRNTGGGVRFSITNVQNPTQADFDKNILATIPYEKFPGAKVKIPATIQPGQYVMEFYWYWPIPATASKPRQERLFVSCSNLTVLPHGHADLTTKQSQDYKMGLPANYRLYAKEWFCNANDPVYTNSSYPTSAPTMSTVTSAPATSAPATSAPATAAPATSAPATAAPATSAPATSAPATAAPATSAPATSAPVPGASGSDTRTVNSGAALEQALADGVKTIVLADGQYNAPSNGYGFKVTAANVNVLAANAGKASIVCQTTGAYGLNVQGAGAYVYGVVISNCASAVYVTSSKATFDTITATNNFNNFGLGSGIHAIVGSVSTVKNSFITGNRGYAGIYCYGTVTLQNTQVTKNEGGGITARYSARVNVVSSVIDGNTGSGIFASESSTVVVDQSSITSNTGAYYGGGIGAINSNVNVTNSIVKGNVAQKQSGGIYIESSVPITVYVASSKVIGNTAPDANNGIYFPVKNGVDVRVVSTTISNSASSIASSADEFFCCAGAMKKSITEQVCSYPAVDPCPAL